MPLFDDPHQYDESDPKYVAPYTGPELKISDWFPGIFIKPQYIFEIMKQRGPRNADWFVPLLIATIVAIILGWFLMQQPGMREYMEQQQVLEYAEELADGSMTMEEVVEQSELRVKTLGKRGFISYPLLFGIGFPLSVLFLWIVCRIITLQKFRFKLAAALMGCVIIVELVWATIVSAVMLLSENYSFAFSLNDLLPTEPGTVSHVLASVIEPFGLYAWVVIGIGLHIAGGVSRGKAIAVPGTMLLLGLIIAVIFAL